MNIVPDDGQSAYVGIGSNLADPLKQVQSAMRAVGHLSASGVAYCSSLYRSAPLGPEDQPDYINAVVQIASTLSARELLAALQKIEADYGRIRNGERWGPRILDLDLLVFGSQVIDQEGLVVPHPRIRERNFVLLPLIELAPDLEVPGQGKVAVLVEQLASAAHGWIEKLEQEI